MLHMRRNLGSRPGRSHRITRMPGGESKSAHPPSRISRRQRRRFGDEFNWKTRISTPDRTPHITWVPTQELLDLPNLIRLRRPTSRIPTAQLQDRQPLVSRCFDPLWSVYAANNVATSDIEACPGICDVSCCRGRGCHGGRLERRVSSNRIPNSAELEGNAIDDVTSLNLLTNLFNP
jgi:hypothetical protein